MEIYSSIVTLAAKFGEVAITWTIPCGVRDSSNSTMSYRVRVKRVKNFHLTSPSLAVLVAGRKGKTVINVLPEREYGVSISSADIPDAPESYLASPSMQILHIAPANDAVKLSNFFCSFSKRFWSDIFYVLFLFIHWYTPVVFSFSIFFFCFHKLITVFFQYVLSFGYSR